MRQRILGQLAVAAVLLAAVGGAGCSRQPDTSQASVESCVQFGIAAIRQHVTVTSLPSACRGLTGAQIDSAVGTALSAAGAGVRGKALRRERIVQASHFLQHLLVTVPAQRSEPQVATPAGHWISTAALGITALCTWLITVALGLAMMARWMLRRRARRGPASKRRRPPARNASHLALAIASLLTWITYLATGIAALAWTATGLLLVVAGLGMTLIFLPQPAIPADFGTAQAAGDRAGDDASHTGGPPVLTIGAHVIFATATILFAFLTAIGNG